MQFYSTNKKKTNNLEVNEFWYGFTLQSYHPSLIRLPSYELENYYNI